MSAFGHRADLSECPLVSTSGAWRTFGCGDELVLSRGGQQFCTNRLCKSEIFCFSAWFKIFFENVPVEEFFPTSV